MAFPKKELFSIEDQVLGRYARALCHPARVFILRRIHANNGLYVHQIERMVPLSKGAVSDHLNTLRSTGFVNVDCQGRFNYYTLNSGIILEAESKTHSFFHGLRNDVKSKIVGNEYDAEGLLSEGRDYPSSPGTSSS